MGDGPALSPAQIEAAAGAGRLSRMAERLVEERDFISLDRLLTHAGLDVIPLDELAASARAIDRAIDRIPEARSSSPATMRELRAVRALAAGTLAHRLRRDPLTAAERSALALAAEIFLSASDAQEAARLFERAGDDARAADAYAALGEIDKMEACHERLDVERGDRHAGHRLRDKIESYLADGQRVAALTLLQACPDRTIENAGLHVTRIDLEQRLCRGRALTLSRRGDPGSSRRIASTPAVIGRDPSVEIPLRDPGVSRRHAVLVSDGGRLAIEDAGSRSGTRIGGADLGARVPLHGDTELTLGPQCRIAVSVLGPDALQLRGLSGLDRALLVLVGIGSVDLARVAPEAAGLALSLAGAVPRLEKATDRRVRVNGQTLGRGCDLLHGDIIELDALVLEVQ